jgi:hypothetical protein
MNGPPPPAILREDSSEASIGNAETLVIWLAEEYGVNIVFVGSDMATKEMTQ